ncbi:MAG: Holliday junction resolvase RuvX [Actinobacteria bacterium]|nr:Holliday junction resolvase RuvX [Actinomycetota bacterium]NBO06801.1 Holliday junction resolvase RuvX [Actinomycetota bacterium]NBP12093.1 Holliday junction resolvase RuvX [Actinomycetota bacterium]NBP42827.1 Holliday junction resolvase RuvX [Actinomycetota bacterium]NBQ66168.1 Holliday junction resolvase RuvX [Actinomycetota bacterium]
MIQGARVAIDYGDKRIGIAKSDNSGLIASPVMTLVNSGSTENIFSAIKDLVEEGNVTLIYIGLPLHLSGRESESSDKARRFATLLRQHLPQSVQVRLLDERLTTTSALGELKSAGLKSNRENIDQLAAVKILEFALEVERLSGEVAGHAI